MEEQKINSVQPVRAMQNKYERSSRRRNQEKEKHNSPVAQKWYHRASAQTAVITGIFLVASTIIAGIFGLFQSRNTVGTSLDNETLQDEVFRNIPANSRANFDPEQYLQEYKGGTIEVRERRGSEGYFRLLPIPATIRHGETINIGLIFSSDFDMNKLEVIYISLEERKVGERYNEAIKSVHYNAQGRLNKLPVVIDVPKGEYILSIGFISPEGKNKVMAYYRTTRLISVN